MNPKILSAASSIFLSLFFYVFSAQGQEHGGTWKGLHVAAKKHTISILSPASSGSGVLIGRRENTYYFLTASHVINGNPLTEEFWAYIPMPDGAVKERIIQVERPLEFEGVDLAIGKFVSHRNLPLVPIISNLFTKSEALGSFNGRTYDEKWMVQGDPVVAGFSLPTIAIPAPIFRSSRAIMIETVTGNRDGYEAAYQALTMPGMSGGGLFGARLCPHNKLAVNKNSNPKNNQQSPATNQYYQYSVNAMADRARSMTQALHGKSHKLFAVLIAIHGRSEEYGQEGRSGISLGVPLYLVQKYFTSNSGKYGIPAGSSFVSLVEELCNKDGFTQ